jgi:hypothetical protein
VQRRCRAGRHGRRGRRVLPSGAPIHHVSRTGISPRARTSGVILSEGRAAPSVAPDSGADRRIPRHSVRCTPGCAPCSDAAGCGGRGWSTPRRPASRRLLRSGILQSRMNAAREKARRTLLQNDAPAPTWAAGHRWRGGAAAGGLGGASGVYGIRRADASHRRTGTPHPTRTLSVILSEAPRRHRPSHQTLAPTEESRATASAARPSARRARTVRVRRERLGHAAPARVSAAASVRDSSVAQEYGAGESTAHAPSE